MSTPHKSLWDSRSPRKLIAIVAEARQLKNKNSDVPKNPCCELRCGKEREKTKQQKKTAEPKFNEMFWFETPADNAPFSLKAKVHDGSDEIGAVELKELATFPQEMIVDQWYDVIYTAKKTDTSEKRGQLRLQLFLSSTPEVRTLTVPAGPPDTPYTYLYPSKNFLDKVKAGDVILYSGFGPLSVFMQLYTCTPFSNIGIVVSLPNKWLKKEELYILELTQNLEAFPCAFADRPIHGIPALYRLEERIHGIYGTEIWWSVLRQHLEANEKTRLAAFVMEIYKEYVNTPVDERKPGSGMHANWEFSPTQESLLTSFGVQPKAKKTFVDFFAAEVVAAALKAAGREALDLPPLVTPAFLAQCKLFDKPTLLRYHQMHEQVLPDVIEEVSAIKMQEKTSTRESRAETRRPSNDFSSDKVKSLPVESPAPNLTRRPSFDSSAVVPRRGSFDSSDTSNPSAPPPLPPKEQRPLPAGWELRLEPSSGRRYYINKTTWVAQWKFPSN